MSTVGANDTGALTNNYGSTTMTKNSGSGSWVGDENGKDGANCAATPIETWWETIAMAATWDWSSIWKVTSGKYPTFM